MRSAALSLRDHDQVQINFDRTADSSLPASGSANYAGDDYAIFLSTMTLPERLRGMQL